MPRRNVGVRWRVATDENMRHIVRSGRALASPTLAHSVHVELEGLEPAREYFYRFMAGPELSPTGRTKTAPAVGASVSGLTFAFASCQQYEHGYFTAYRRMAEEDLDLVVHLGDYIYEYGPGEDVASDGNVRAHDRRVSTLGDFRDRYALYRTDEDLKAAHAAFPWIVTWDDHEVENNYAGEFPEEGPESPVFVQRRAAAYQAYYEHMPLRRSSMPRGPDMPIYRRLVYGDLVDFSVLDTRQYRDDQASGDGKQPPSPEAKDPGRTLLGSRQERWLLNGLSASKARWNVVAQQVFFARFDAQDGVKRMFEMDAWDGYEAQRNRIVERVAEEEIDNLVVLTGNVHGNWANEILTNFDDPDSSTSVGTEFVGTSISSGGDGSDVRPGTLETMDENPHVKFWNDQRGYVRCRLTPDAWQTDFRVLPYVKEPGAPIATRASLVVENGDPRVQMASG
jgi:alkaline phosphatase D